jgi:K+-sensing histidine kinase KdpD
VKSQLGDDSQIEIAANDKGPGLLLGKADQVFDAFLNYEATRQRHGPGNGSNH